MKLKSVLRVSIATKHYFSTTSFAPKSQNYFSQGDFHTQTSTNNPNLKAHKVQECDDSMQIMDLPQIKLPDAETLFRGSNFDFPCLNRRFVDGPEPNYQKTLTGFKLFKHEKPFHFFYNKGVLPQIQVAYETWGELNEEKNNAILLYTGLSASSHAAHHEDNKAAGWWDQFIGPGRALDTNKFFVICANQLGGCYGSTGPSSKNPLTGRFYGTHFPMVSIKDMINAQRLLLESLSIKKLYAAVGSSLGGMCSVAMAAMHPSEVGRVISISACAKTHPSAIAMRYLQRRCIMEDPNWNLGHYYEGDYPLKGMKLAREIGTLTYRSGLEWEQRFGRSRIPGESPSLCHNFEIEQYIEYQGLQFATKYDPNSLLYISKAMDLFDVSEYFEESDDDALSNVTCPVLVMGATSDVIFPIEQQRALTDRLRKSGNDSVSYYEMNSIYGHDTFLLDLTTVGTAVKGFLETELANNGHLSKSIRK